MATKIFDWFIRNFILPKYKDYKNPGFIIVSFNTPNNKSVFFREVLFPENLFSTLEKSLVEKNPEKETLLYNIGTTLGKNFGRLFHVPNLKEDNKEDIDKYAKFTFKFNFSTWCKDAEITEFDLDNKSISLQINDHIICRQNGLGYLLTEGAEAGFGKHMMYDNTMETVQINCQGRGDKDCKTLWRTKSFFEKNNIPHKTSNILYEIEEFSLEKKYNYIQKCKYATKSTYNMINSKIFSLDAGKITFKNQVFFDCTVLLYYLLEKFIPTDKESQELLFNTGFDYGEKLAENEKLEFIPQILSALGWGDTYITKKEGIIVQINYFPWSSIIEEKVEFYLFRGMLSGMITKALKREVLFMKYEKIVKNNSLTMIFKE